MLNVEQNYRYASINSYVRYYSMFNGYFNLYYIFCLATDISAYSCTTDWVNNVAASGNFYLNSASDWDTGLSAVPSGWTRNLYY